MAGLKLLAIDTSTQACSVALQSGSDLVEDFRIIPRAHNRELLPMVQELLNRWGIRPEDLDCIAFARGPGSFTGIRITVGVVQGLAFGGMVPVAPISTLACLAQGYTRRTGRDNCLVAVTAREDEVYYGRYQLIEGLMFALEDDKLASISELSLPMDGGWYGVGNGWSSSLLIERAAGCEINGIDVRALPHARDLLAAATSMHQQGKTIDAMQARPVYLRETVARKSKGISE